MLVPLELKLILDLLYDVLGTNLAVVAPLLLEPCFALGEDSIEWLLLGGFAASLPGSATHALALVAGRGVGPERPELVLANSMLEDEKLQLVLLLLPLENRWEWKAICVLE